MAAPRLQRVWTAEEAAALQDDGNLYEVIAGELWPMTGTNWPHMTVLVNLLDALRPFLDAIGASFGFAEVNVWLPTGNLVHPDLFVVTAENTQKIAVRGLEGAPDIAIEVLSPSNRRHDLITKRRAYALAGVREYWIVDPSIGSVEVLTLDRDAYTSRGFFAEDDVVTSGVLLGWEFPVRGVFKGVRLGTEAEDPA